MCQLLGSKLISTGPAFLSHLVFPQIMKHTLLASSSGSLEVLYWLLEIIHLNMLYGTIDFNSIFDIPAS
jgi:hypothetical protein